MWITKREWEELNFRVKKCEEDIGKTKENTEALIRYTAKRILEQPDELLEEINGIEGIENMVKELLCRR